MSLSVAELGTAQRYMVDGNGAGHDRPGNASVLVTWILVEPTTPLAIWLDNNTATLLRIC
jgi:hypothetical protein